MEFLVTMTTHIPDGIATRSRRRDPVPGGRAFPRAGQRRATCCACGVRRCSRANGAPSDCSPPPTTPARGGARVDATASLAHRRGHAPDPTSQ